MFLIKPELPALPSPKLKTGGSLKIRLARLGRILKKFLIDMDTDIRCQAAIFLVEKDSGRVYIAIIESGFVKVAINELASVELGILERCTDEQAVFKPTLCKRDFTKLGL
jgi:hypothetical protein